MKIAFLLLWGVFFYIECIGQDVLVAEHLDAKKLSRINELVAKKSNLEASEREYHQLVQKQTFSDLIRLYLSEASENVEITYASFTPEDKRRENGDLGFGLHVIKRFLITVAGTEIGNGHDSDLQRLVVVNEHWGENKSTGGLLLPDHIRIKTQILSGEKDEITEEHFLFDSIRLSWGAEPNDLNLCRQNLYHYDDVTRSDKRLHRRVPVSAPFSCTTCHDSSSTRAQRFLQPGERQNSGFIVQDSHFKKPLNETFGYQEYLKYLTVRLNTKKDISESSIKQIKRELMQPKRFLRIPNILDVLRDNLQYRSYCWMGEDSELLLAEYSINRQGVYKRNGRYFLDAMENMNEAGKYLYWNPIQAIPSMPKN